MAEEFLFDDFFVSQDPAQSGMVVELPLLDINGNERNVPITMKRGLSFGDQQAAKENAVKKRIKPNGEMEIVSVDEDIFAIELVARGVKSWPFKYSNGAMVPVTRETVKLMLADGVAVLAGALTERIQNSKKSREPFTKPSDQS